MSRVALAAVLLGAATTAVALPERNTAPAPRPVLARATAPLAHANSHDGRAILSVADMRPGDRRTGEVTIRNQGGAGGLALAARATGPLAERLRLTVARDSGTTMIDAPMTAVPACTPVGDLAPGALRTFRFTVAFDRSPDDNAYANATARADFEWRDRCVPEPAQPLAVGDVRLAIAPGPYRFAARTGTARLGVRCVSASAGTCRGRIELERRVAGQGRGIALAVGAIAVPQGRRKTIAVRLNKRARRHIGRAGTVPVRVYVTMSDAQGRRHRVAYRDRLVYGAR